MKSRLVAGAVALVAAILGVILVLSYANGADRRAMAGLTPTEVLVVAKAVPEGTPVEELAGSLETRSLPADAVVPAALTSLDGQAGTVTTTALTPGEQLLPDRLASPETLAEPGTVPVPKGLQEVSFQLDPQRAVGGRLAAGDTVGLFLSFDNGAVPSGQGPESTSLALHTVLLTSVQRAPQAETADAATALPAGSLLITVAVTDEQAQKIVFTAEYGSIWLSKEPADATRSATSPVDRKKVYQ
ncbi:Flp pilus assembly protein CpaB [Sinomonas mesophila]|uniref:Flp pilus assembly protein CpaB n=1 Tax=Sinomonas mesophila TaxID=1531955 RepID=UPI0009856431|nr:RcpC/CpaB family pilus assembly protein [Sinomonas mesophila]